MPKESTSPSLYQRLLSTFGRVTSSGRYIPEIDGLRFLAIVLVMLFHSHYFFLDGSEAMNNKDALAENGLHLLNYFVAKGWFGVQIFFVISGMVLALPYAAHYFEGGRKPELKRYFRRRLIRIETPYFITLTFFYLLGITLYGNPISKELSNYLAGLLYAHTLFYDGALNPVLTVAWTLEVEIQFYLLAPFLCRLLAIQATPNRRIILLGSIFLSTYFSGWMSQLIPSSIWGHSIVGQLSYFLVGILLADLYINEWQNKPLQKLTKVWDIVGCVAWPLCFVVTEYSPWVDWRPIMLLIAFTAVLRGHYLRAVFSLKWVTTIGAMCYTLYLFHSFFFHSILKPHLFDPYICMTPGDWPYNYLIMFLMSALTIPLCGLVFLLVEKPFAQGKWIFSKKSKPDNSTTRL